MKYKVTKTDIFINKQLIPEGSVIDSKNYDAEDIESVAHLLVPVETEKQLKVTVDTDLNDGTAVEQTTKPKSKHSKNNR